jgi:bifunctional enzyme CysN/CysC
MAKEPLRLTTTGSVDDGKSTLIGRLLFETKTIFEDQLLAIEKTSTRRGQGEVDLSLLLDGLAAEREQGITIDVAYRYFGTAKRRFIIADTPGHEQYTRNMITGASQAQLAIILIDASKGVQVQSRRHGFLLSLLRVPHLIVAINKMDKVDYSEAVYQDIVDAYSDFSQKLDIHDIRYIPVSALKGDNVTTRSEHMPWYTGSTLLHTLENVEVAADHNLIDFRFPVQYVMGHHNTQRQQTPGVTATDHPTDTFRGYAGKVASGQIRPGEAVAILPRGTRSRVREVLTYDGPLAVAGSGDSVVITLEDERDISRGDMLVRPENLPHSAQDLDTMLCWLGDAPMVPAKTYLLKHTTRTVKVQIEKLHYRMDVNTLSRVPSTGFVLNEIGRVELHTAAPLLFDAYANNRTTGSFILIDPENAQTVAAGMIRGTVRHLVESDAEITPELWARRNTHQGAVIWLTGYSGAGKSTLAKALHQRLFDQLCQVVALDGDQLRQGLCQDLGFSAADRSENIRRAGEVARLFYLQGNLVICSFISPFQADRDAVRAMLPSEAMLEIHVDCDLQVCQQRDVKGLYRKALSGEIPEFTGISSPYEAPLSPDLRVRSDQQSIADCVNAIIELLAQRKLLSL